jgi:hypothetical protein
MNGKCWRAFWIACAWLTAYAAFTVLTRGESPAHLYNPLAVSLGVLFLLVRSLPTVPLRSLTLLSAVLGLWHGLLAVGGRALIPSDNATPPALFLIRLVAFAALSGAVAGASMLWVVRHRATSRLPVGSDTPAP